MRSLEEPKKTICQEESGSPAQIWADLDCLATEILGSIETAHEWADKFVYLNETADSMQIDRGTKTLSAECEQRHTHAHTHAHIA